jgi:protein LSM14
MAKLPGAGRQPQPQAKGEPSEMDNLSRKVHEMRTDDGNRHSRQPGTGGHFPSHRGGRGPRGGRRDQSGAKPVEVPTTDFDFETSNAKFNKQDIVKEAIATGSPEANGLPFDSPAGNGSTANGDIKEKDNEDVVIPPQTTYDKKSSFFDNISSESKDREDRERLAGQEFRSEERKKNMETFGQGSVDNNYRGGFRGRGRGRGGFRGGRGNYNNNNPGGFAGRGRGGGGGFRGGRGGAQQTAETS